MLQVLQGLSTGATVVGEVPTPRVPSGGLLIGTRRSLISAGTERMLVDFSRAGWLEKARQQPEKVRQVLDKVRTDGLMQTLAAVRSKLDQPLPLGYCNVGTVLAVGTGVTGFAIGDRVASNGPHAESVAVPQNLCAHIPCEVSDDQAAFTVLGAIAVQGVRLAAPTLGECFAVSGLGLIGLITVQLLRANGCRVIAFDPDPAKTAMARRFGAEAIDLTAGSDPVAIAESFSRGRGVDGVLITAATESSEPVSQAARMCRKRGRIVLVGVTGLALNRSDFYEKELTFQVSCSYGPGRYDPGYEEQGRDYPVGFVRWTEQRNFEAVLDMIAAGRLDVEPLITHRFRFRDAPAAYDLLASGSAPYLGIMLDYEDPAPSRESAATIALAPGIEPIPVSVRGSARVAFIGAGNYGGRVLIPAFASAGAELYGVASGRGVTAAHYGKKFGFTEVTTDAERLIDDANVDAIVIATRHDSHARFVCRALEAGKHVFVEKPLALNTEELDEIEQVWLRSSVASVRPIIMVGFNRRFAAHALRMKALLDRVTEPKSFIVTVNAGAVPADHWTQDPAIGGGRIVGEGCHFIDLLRFLAGAPITQSRVTMLGGDGDGRRRGDRATITLSFADGSVGTVHYLANGHRSFPKERIEAFCAGRVLQLDNFRVLNSYGWPGRGKMRLWRQDKGQGACARAFVDAIRRNAPSPIPMNELLEVGRVTVSLGEQAR